jgi:zinc transporter
MKDDGLICAYALDGDGGGRELSLEEASGIASEKGFVWIHLDYAAPGAQRWLREKSGLDEIIVSTLLAPETRPRSVAVDGGLLVTLRGVNLNPGADPEDMVGIRMWIEHRRVISTRKRRLLAVDDIRGMIGSAHGPKTPGEFLIEMSDRLATRMSDVIEGLDDTVDTLEEEVLIAESHELRTKLAQARRETILLRRYLAPQREALARLQAEKTPLLTDTDRMQLREVTDRITRYVEDLDAARERAAVTQEELSNRLSEQINKRMYVLSIVAAIFLPLGFATGLLGINVGGIPGAEFAYAFAIVCLVLVGIVIFQFIVFRWRRWL